MDKLLSEAEFLEEFAKYKLGDQEALARIVKANQGLIGYVADRHATRLHFGRFRAGLQSLIEWADMMQAGNVGLLVALKRFDPDRGSHFSTYARDWIDKHIWLFINSCLLVKTARFQFRNVTSIDREGEPRYLSRKGVQEKQGKEERKDLVDVVGRMLELLPERDREILKLRFGLEDGIEYQLADIAERFGITKQTVCNVIRRGLNGMMFIYRRYEKTGKITPR